VKTLRIQMLLISHFASGEENVAADFRGTRTTGDTKAIASTGNFHIESAFDLS